jgi:beta-lactamase class A
VTRPLLLAVVLALLSGGVAAAGGPAAGNERERAREWRRAFASAERYARTRDGRVSVALIDDTGVLRRHRSARPYPSASVVKAMLLVAYPRSARDRPLRADEKRLLDPMIRKSDNAATNVIFTRVGTTGLKRLAKTAGMARFKPASPIWGNSQITARDQTRFFLAIDTLLPARHRAYGLRLLRTVVSSQRWGIGRLELPDWQVYFKGGWGSGTGAVDHQVALLVRGEERIAIAVLTADNGSHAAGKKTLEGVFARLLSP